MIKTDSDISKLILKNILLKEINEAGEQYNPEDGVETPFERDPMGFILKKYTTLDNVLKELMSDSYKEYLDAIFIVAPKPTTFKVMLHNGQFFFLTFMGKAYQATVQGKDYYLMTLGEKERCMQAIARVLRYGSPLKTKGPEGAEQGTRPEGEETGAEGGGTEAGGGGENTGMEGDWAEKTGNAPAAGEEEPIAETIILEAALKKSLQINQSDLKDSLKDELQSFDTTVLESILKKSVYEVDSPLEKILKTKKGDTESFTSVFTALEKNNTEPKRKTDGGLHIRTSFEDDPSELEKILNKGGIKSNQYKIKVIEKNKPGSLSGSFRTYVIAFNSGEKVNVVNTRKTSASGAKTTLTQKSLTPKSLGLEDREFKTLDQLVKSAKASITSKNIAYSQFLNLLIDDVLVGTVAPKQLAKITTVKEEVKYSSKTEKEGSAISAPDLAIIGKDFGEVLGAVFLGKMSGVKEGIMFPGQGNYGLIDFFIDGYKISSKYDKGASASITDLVKGIDPKRLKDKKELDFYNTLKMFVVNTGPNAFIQVAAAQKMPAVSILASILKTSEENINSQVINDYLIKLIAGKNNKEKIAIINKKFDKFFKEVTPKSSPESRPEALVNPNAWNRVRPQYTYGLITSPLSYYVVRKFNEEKKYLDFLKTLVSKTEVKQMYLKFEPKKSSMSFNIKSFNDPNASFIYAVPSTSAFNPSSSKLGFKLK